MKMIERATRRLGRDTGTVKRSRRRSAVDHPAARANAGTSAIPMKRQTKLGAPLRYNAADCAASTSGSWEIAIWTYSGGTSKSKRNR